MKKISFILTMAMLFSIGSMSANDNLQPTRQLTSQISKMLKKDTISFESEGSAAEVRLTVDSFGKIHVLSINTTDENLEKFLRESIDQKSVQQGSYQLGIVYRVPIEIADQT